MLFAVAVTKKPDPEAWTEVKRRKPSSSKADTKVSMRELGGWLLYLNVIIACLFMETVLKLTIFTV